MTKLLSALLALTICLASLIPSIAVHGHIPEHGFSAYPKHVKYELKFNGSKAYEHVARQCDFGYRIPNTTASLECADYIFQTLKEYDFIVEYQNFTGESGSGKGVEFHNVIGVMPSRDNSRFLILGAHYDTRPFAEYDETNKSTPILGANDGASGVAVLLELARILKQKEFNVTIILAFFDGEDFGNNTESMFYGSTYHAQSLNSSLIENTIGMILLDMVGDKDLNIYREGNSNKTLTDFVWSEAEQLGYNAFINQTGYTILDDHIPFNSIGIPSIDIIDFDYEYWHTTEDTVDKVSAESLEIVGRVVEQCIYLLAEAREKEEWIYIDNQTVHIKGDWYVDDVMQLERMNITLDGNLLISNSLTLNSVNLIMNYTDDTKGIYVYGELILTNSTLSASNAYYIFRVYGCMKLINSSISRITGSYANGGIEIFSDSVEIRHCRIFDNIWYAIQVRDSSPVIDSNIIELNNIAIQLINASPLITNNTISKNKKGMACIASSFPRVEGNVISDNSEEGIFLENTELQENYIELHNNTIESNAHGIYGKFTSINSVGNRFLSNSGWAIFSLAGKVYSRDDTFEGNAEGNIIQKWVISVYVVDKNGEAITGANITVYNAFGETEWSLTNVLTFRSNTVTEYALLGNGTNISFSPHKIFVKKDGYKDNSTDIRIDGNLDIIIVLEEESEIEQGRDFLPVIIALGLSILMILIIVVAVIKRRKRE